MHIWIDIDKPELAPFYKSLISELESREHKVTVTAENKDIIKLALNDQNINAEYIGSSFSIFGLLEDKSTIIRSALLSDYVKEKGINLAFSFGSKVTLFTCIGLNINIVLFLDNLKEKINQIHFNLDNIFFIIPDSIPENSLTEKGFNLKKIAKFKGSIQKDAINPNPKVIKEIVSKIELFSSHKDIKA